MIFKCSSHSSFNSILSIIGIIIFIAILFPHFSSPAFTEEFPQSRTVQTPLANLYEKPSDDSPVLLQIEKGQPVVLLFTDKGWYAVKLATGQLAWAHESIFQDFSPEPITATEPVKPETSPNEPKDQTPPEIAAVESVPQIEKELGETIVVSVPTGRVRESPSLNASVEFGIKEGETVTLIEKKDEWYNIKKSDGRSGWAHHSLFHNALAYEPKQLEKSDISEAPKVAAVTETENRSGQQNILKEIRFETTQDGDEKVIFQLNSFNPPTTFVLEEQIPKIVCDFTDTQLAKGIKKITSVNGNLIQKIRIGIHNNIPKEPKVRVVLDLIPKKDYEVEQTFFKKESYYILTFKSRKG